MVVVQLTWLAKVLCPRVDTDLCKPLGRVGLYSKGLGRPIWMGWWWRWLVAEGGRGV